MRSLGTRGFTFTEITVVIVLAGVVTLGLVGFYLNSQATWMDASAQALAQRDATTLVETITHRAHEASGADVFPVAADSANSILILLDSSNAEIDRFEWSLTDSLVHHWELGVDRGAVMSSKVERFKVSEDVSPRLIHLDSLRVRSATGQQVVMASTFALFNAP